jgi:hypothetical protein
VSHRSYGETHDCKGCRYWSEMIAGCNGDGPVKALCLAPKPAPNHGQYMAAWQKCDAWASGHLGAVDEPGQDPLAYDDEPESLAIGRNP